MRKQAGLIERDLSRDLGCRGKAMQREVLSHWAAQEPMLRPNHRGPC